MKVSLRRKIHIMALPQWTFLNASWSDDQSATKLSNPLGSAAGSAVTWSAMVYAVPCRTVQVLCFCLGGQQQIEESEPNHEQEVPVDGAQINAQAYLGGLSSVPHFGRGAAPG